jgi:hypothetical protein
MADITITPASVLASSAAVLRREFNIGYASATAGQHVYLDSSNLWQKVDSNASATGNELTAISGILLNAGGIAQPGVVCVSDVAFTPGGTLTNGSAVYSSTTAGGIAHDVPASGSYPRFLGIAKSTTVMHLNPVASGVVI